MTKNIHVPGIKSSDENHAFVYTPRGFVNVGKIRNQHKNKTGNNVTVKKNNKVYEIDESSLSNYLRKGYIQINKGDE